MNLSDKIEDFEWIKKYQTDHQETLNQLIKKYYTYIYKSFIYRGVPAIEAEDCTQDVCLRLIRNLKQFRFESSFKTFLDRTITNKTIDFYRRQPTILNTVSLFIKLFENDSDVELINTLKNYLFEDPEQAYNFHTLLRVLEICIELIKNLKQKKLVALWLDGHKRKQMAALLDIPIGTVNASLERGKTTLRNCIRKKYF